MRNSGVLGVMKKTQKFWKVYFENSKVPILVNDEKAYDAARVDSRTR